MADFLRFSKSFLITIFIIAFILNWIWEMAQMFAYVETRNQPLSKTFLFCTMASVGDAVLTVGGFGVGAKFFDIGSGWKIYGFMSLFGALCAIVIEIIATGLGLWTYNEAMPSVPFINTGVLPLLQLTLLMPAALWLAVRWKGEKK